MTDSQVKRCDFQLREQTILIFSIKSLSNIVQQLRCAALKNFSLNPFTKCTKMHMGMIQRLLPISCVFKCINQRTGENTHLITNPQVKDVSEHLCHTKTHPIFYYQRFRDSSCIQTLVCPFPVQDL